jgi:hypothetical protein
MTESHIEITYTEAIKEQSSEKYLVYPVRDGKMFTRYIGSGRGNTPQEALDDAKYKIEKWKAMQFSQQLEELVGDYHISASGHDPENFRGCTHIVCKSIKKAIRNL